MAITVFLNPLILINAVDLSNHANKVTISGSFASVDATAFGAAMTTVVKGLGDAKITVDFLQDEGAASVDQTLWPLFQSASTFPVEIRPVNAARSTTNPAYLMTALLMTYDPIDASVGAMSTTSVEFLNGAQAGLTRATA
jgi:hypothetical protein